MNSPKVTVLCPFFRRKNFVERTLVSISNQDYENFEAIVWDDNSNDGTWEELVRVAEKLGDGRIQVLKNDHNLGLYKGLNNGIDMARGDYIAVVGSGDICMPDRLSKQVKALDENINAVFCATASTTLDELTGDEFSDESFHGKYITSSDMIKVVPFTHGTVMFRTKELKTAGKYETVFTWCADWDLFFRLCENGNKAVYINDVCYKRYATVDGVSFDPTKSVLQVKCKYLVKRLFGKSLIERKKILNEAAESLDYAVDCYKAEIAWDLFKRQIKLILMGRLSKADELGALINEKYGFSLKRRIMLLICQCVRWLPFSRDRLINFFRRFG